MMAMLDRSDLNHGLTLTMILSKIRVCEVAYGVEICVIARVVCGLPLPFFKSQLPAKDMMSPLKDQAIRLCSSLIP